MNRDRAYNRKQRVNHIRRRMKIMKEIFGNDWYETHNGGGYFAKYNLVCSCPMCSSRTRNKGRHRSKQGNYTPAINYKHSDAIKVVKLNQSLEEYSSSVEEGALLRR